MNDPTTRFISQMKLRALRGHRARLGASYNCIEATLVEGEPDVHALVSLYRELEGMRVAGRPLHPELEHLEHVFDVFARRAPEPALLQTWYARVRHSLTRGRARARWVEIFGQALADLASAQAPPEEPPTQELLAAYLRPGLDPAPYAEALREAVATIERPALAWMHSAWTDDTETCPLRRRVEVHELTAALARITSDTCRPSDLRAQAERFTQDGALVRELTDAMSLQFEHLEEWSWPDGEAGVEAEATWMRHRWRLQLMEDLPTACLLELLGDRLGGHLLDTLEGGSKVARISRLERLIRLDAPRVVIENERRMLDEADHQEVNYDAFVWEDALGVRLPEMIRDPRGFDVYGTILEHRRTRRGELASASASAGYELDAHTSAADGVLTWVHSEVALARAAWPEQPVWVVKLDVEGFFPNLHHAPLLDMLSALGFPDALRELFSRVLAVPAPGGAQWTRGVPVGRGHARALSEVLMHLLERVVGSKARVRVIRIVDDVCFMTPSLEHAERAWEAAVAFLSAFDLAPNMSKCGALGLNTQRTSEVLPPGAPGWAIWRMEADDAGELAWALDDAHMGVLVGGARERVHQAPTLIDAVRAYNEALRAFESGLAMRRRLDASHRDAIGEALTRFEEGVFGEEGALEWCRAHLDERDRGALTEALLHWPITAGGLGLCHAHVHAARFDTSWRAWRAHPAPGERDQAWEVRSHDWGRFFSQWSEPLADVHVQASPQMEALITDFIERGSEVGGRHQQNLGPYWRAIVLMYGPSLLDRFGTFRFLLTELVPLRLITHGDSGLGDELDGPVAGGQSGYGGGSAFDDDDIPF